MTKVKSRFLQVVLADTNHKDPDMGTEAQKFYIKYFPESINSKRGETWFTPIALLEEIFNIRKKLCDNKGLLKSYKLDLISNISKNILNEEVGIDYHTLANFGCLPSELNIWRGGEDYENLKLLLPRRLYLFNRSRLGDFPDLFLLCVKSYLTGESEEGYDPLIEGNKLKEFDLWFKEIGEGKICTWEEFVIKMHLKGSFVDDNFEVVKLFDHKIGNPFPNLQEIYELESEYTIENLTHLLSKNPQIKACIENIYKIWNNRASYFEKG